MSISLDSIDEVDPYTALKDAIKWKSSTYGLWMYYAMKCIGSNINITDIMVNTDIMQNLDSLCLIGMKFTHGYDIISTNMSSSLKSYDILKLKQIGIPVELSMGYIDQNLETYISVLRKLDLTNSERRAGIRIYNHTPFDIKLLSTSLCGTKYLSKVISGVNITQCKKYLVSMFSNYEDVIKKYPIMSESNIIIADKVQIKYLEVLASKYRSPFIGNRKRSNPDTVVILQS